MFDPTEVDLTVSLDYLESLDKGALVELLKAGMATSSLALQDAFTIARECGVDLIETLA